MGRSIYVFVDTHFFLHHKAASECDWRALLGKDVDEVTVVVCRTVQKEIDKHKHEKSGRTQRRARNTASLVGKIVEADAPQQLRATKPRVLLNFVLPPRGFVPPNGLNPSWGDDQITADILAFCTQYPDARVVLLTADVGLRATAKSYGLEAMNIPDAWRLVEEPDETARENARLKEEIATLSARGPKLVGSFEFDDCPVEVLELGTWFMPPPTGDQLNRVVEGILARHPMKASFDDLPAGGFQFTPPKPEAIETYRKAHSAWQVAVDAHVRRAVERIGDRQIVFDVDLGIENTVVEPADDFRIKLTLTGPFEFYMPPEMVRQRIPQHDAEPPRLDPLPSPPAPPQPTLVLSGTTQLASLRTPLDSLAHHAKPARDFARLLEQQNRAMNVGTSVFGVPSQRFMSPSLLRPHLNLSLRSNRDPQKVYWVTDSDDRVGTTELELECAQFAHQSPVDWTSLTLRCPITSGQSLGGELRATLSARNLRKPVAATLPIRIAVTEHDPLDFITRQWG